MKWKWNEIIMVMKIMKNNEYQRKIMKYEMIMISNENNEIIMK